MQRWEFIVSSHMLWRFFFVKIGIIDVCLRSYKTAKAYAKMVACYTISNLSDRPLQVGDRIIKYVDAYFICVLSKVRNLQQHQSSLHCADWSTTCTLLFRFLLRWDPKWLCLQPNSLRQTPQRYLALFARILMENRYETICKRSFPNVTDHLDIWHSNFDQQMYQEMRQNLPARQL